VPKVRCSKCRAKLAKGAAYCSACGTAIGGSAGAEQMEGRRKVGLEVLEQGHDASGVQCPNCGGDRMRTIRSDAEENLFWSGAFMLIGIVSLVVVFIGGDMDLLVANLSTVALVTILIGVLLFAIARQRRRPSAFDCPDCGYRLP
jgi:predicted RNA-binding Zn-ribbon protein involved in translation (DUF1610 family)